MAAQAQRPAYAGVRRAGKTFFAHSLPIPAQPLSCVQPIHQFPKRLDAPALPAHSGSQANPSSFNNARSASNGLSSASA
jgi:hypothetical protein